MGNQHSVNGGNGPPGVPPPPPSMRGSGGDATHTHAHAQQHPHQQPHPQHPHPHHQHPQHPHDPSSSTGPAATGPFPGASYATATTHNHSGMGSGSMYIPMNHNHNQDGGGTGPLSSSSTNSVIMDVNHRSASDTSMANMDPDGPGGGYSGTGSGGGPSFPSHTHPLPNNMTYAQAQLAGFPMPNLAATHNHVQHPQQHAPPPLDPATITSSSSMDFINIDNDTIPTVFKWEHGGRQVYITGTFNNWSRQIPMHRSGNDFTYIHNLKRGKHAFKFIVDDEWRFAPDQPTVADIEGRINNFIDVSDFKPYTGDKDFEKEKAAAEYGIPTSASMDDPEGDVDELVGIGGGGAAGASSSHHHHHHRPDKDGEVFSHNMPDLDDYTKEPPPLPPHLRHIILNKPPQLQDTAALPVPQHVALNHLYCTAIKDNMMVLGITQRYKTKFVTTVYYSPCSSK